MPSIITPYHKSVSAVTSKRTRFSRSGKNPVFPFWKNHPLSEDTKFKLSLCMLLVFCASRNVSFNDNNHILTFFTQGFENLPSSSFLILKICYYWAVWLHWWYFLFGKFYLDIHNKMAVTLLPHEKQILILVRTVFFELIYLSGDLKTINYCINLLNYYS